MDFKIAEKIHEIAISFDHGLGDIDMLISSIAIDDEKKEWVMRLSNVMRAINEELIIPVLKEYPSLDCD